MEAALEDVKEKLWEMDTSTRNNLVFYGVREGPRGDEALLKEMFRTTLDITREVPFGR